MSDHGEHEAIAEGAIVMPLHELGALTITGADRQTWLAGMVTSDVKALAPGQAAYALVVDKTGRLLAEAWVLIDTDRIRVGVRRELIAGVRAHLEGYLVMEDAELAEDDSVAWWLACGPHAERVGVEARRIGGAAGSGALAALPIVLIALPADSCANPAEDLTAGSGAVLATPDGWNAIRVERLLPAYGADFVAGCYPQEAHLEHLAVSFNKGCYVGQEAVFMLEKRGHPSRRLVRLHATGPVPVAVGDDVRDATGETVGTVTSTAAVGADRWALAMLRHKASANGTALRVGQAVLTVRDPAA